MLRIRSWNMNGLARPEVWGDIAAGDLNLLHRHGECGDAYWGARYASVFDRAEALGLVIVGPLAPNGRVADHCCVEIDVA